jgi:hypothetical protein
MSTWILPLGGLACALLWLALLVATAFSMVVVSLGLLVALYTLNASAGRPQTTPRRTRSPQPAVDRSELSISER